MRVVLGTISSTLPERLTGGIGIGTRWPDFLWKRIDAVDTRQQGGRCIGSFWPHMVGVPIQERHLAYDWNGDQVVRYFDFRRDVWVGLI